MATDCLCLRENVSSIYFIRSQDMNMRALPLLIAALVTGTAHADEAELRARLEKLSVELEAVKAELKKLSTQTEAIASQQEATAKAPASQAKSGEQTATSAASHGSGTDAAVASAVPGQVSIFGYGEINYNRPRRDTSQTQADLRRAVVGFGYRYNEKTRFVSEFEWEHAITSASDQGESAVEQFFVDHKLSNAVNLKAGLFLIPTGLLNESHEPPRFYGVERNFVETAIIPTTWREGGVGLYGTTAAGLAWDVGITTGFDLSKWDAASSEGRESPLGSIHQELQLAKAKDVSTYASLNYRGLPGFAAGGSISSGKAGQGTAGFAGADSRVTLWELHTRWQPNNWDLSALYAKGTISNTADLNLTFAGQPTPVPKEFSGWYAQAAYKVWEFGDYSLSPFVRYERFNTAEAYEPMPPGLAVDPSPTERVLTYGLSFRLHPNVVLKTDYQKFKVDDTRDRFNLGLGLMF
jgi:hypothetical protein